MIAEDRERPQADAGGGAREPSASDGIASALGDARAHLDALIEATRERAGIALARAQLRLYERALQVVGLMLLVVLVITCVVGGAWMFMRGLRGGLGRIAPEWVADLTAGTLALGGVAIGLFLVRARLYRGILDGLAPEAPTSDPDEEQAP